MVVHRKGQDVRLNKLQWKHKLCYLYHTHTHTYSVLESLNEGPRVLMSSTYGRMSRNCHSIIICSTMKSVSDTLLCRQISAVSNKLLRFSIMILENWGSNLAKKWYWVFCYLRRKESWWLVLTRPIGWCLVLYQWWRTWASAVWTPHLWWVKTYGVILSGVTHMDQAHKSWFIKAEVFVNLHWRVTLWRRVRRRDCLTWIVSLQMKAQQEAKSSSEKLFFKLKKEGHDRQRQKHLKSTGPWESSPCLKSDIYSSINGE